MDKNSNNAKSLTVEEQKNRKDVTVALLDKGENIDNKQPKTRAQLIKAYSFVLLYGVCGSVNSILLKRACLLSGSDSGVIRYFLQMSVMLSLVCCKRQNPLGPRDKRKWLTYRGLSNLVAMICSYFAIKFIEPSSYRSISHSSIIITIIFARIILKEKVTFIHFIALILTLGGILFISKPTFLLHFIDTQYSKKQIYFNDTLNSTNEQIGFCDARGGHPTAVSQNTLFVSIGVILSIISALGTGLTKVALRKLCKENVPFAVRILYPSYYGLPICLFLSTVLTFSGVTHSEFEREKPYILTHFLYTLAAGCISLSGSIFSNIAFQYEDASRLSIIRTLDVVFTFFLQYFLLDIKVDVYSIIGSTSIISGAFLVLIFKIRESSQKKKQVS